MYNKKIPRSESTAIKGILIILIILGHFQPYIMLPKFVKAFIYAFHVNCFLILPLLYPIKQLNRIRIKNYFARLMVPYIILFCIFFCSSLVWKIIHSLLSGQDVITYIMRGAYSSIMGGYYPLFHCIKMRYLWFLPLMFTFSVIKDYYFTDANKRMRYILLIAGFVLYCILWVCFKGPYCSELRETVMYMSPLSVWQAIGALFMGVISVSVLRIMNDCSYKNVIFAIFFIALFILYGITPADSIYLLVLKFLIPIVAFAVLYGYKSFFAQLKLLRKFGEHSFEIYIVQTPICIIMYTVLRKYVPTDSIFIRAISFVFVLAICYYVAILLLKMNIVKRFLFPRTWDEFIGKIVK